jgi:hypothetical protein
MKTLNLGSLNLSVIRPGQKVSNYTAAEVSTTPTVNKFNMNPLASSKLGVKAGDKIYLIEDTNSDDLNAKYYIGKTSNPKGVLLTSPTKSVNDGVALAFSYSVIWGKILQAKDDAVDLPIGMLVKEGLVAERVIIKKDKDGNPILDADGNETTTTTYSALKKVFFELGESVDAEIEGEDITLFQLTNHRVESHTPRQLGESAGVDVDEDND